MLKYIQDNRKNKNTNVKYTYYCERGIRNIRNFHSKLSVVDDQYANTGDVWVDISTFDSFIKSSWLLINQAKLDDRFPEPLRHTLINGLTGSKIASPSFLLAVEDLQDKVNFKPQCAKKVEVYPQPEIAKLPTFATPAVSPVVIRAALRAEAKYPQFNQSFLRATFHKHGYPSYNVSGNSKRAHSLQKQKLSSNIVRPTQNITSELYLSLLKMWSLWGVSRFSMGFMINYEKFEQLLKKDTSIGYIPVQFYEIIDGSIKRATGLKKKDIASVAIDMFAEYVENLEDWIISGKSGPCPKISIVDVEMLKYEIVWRKDIIDNPDITVEQVEEALEKVRLFYMASIFDYMLSVVCFKPISDTVRHRESAIGIKVEAGGLVALWDILAGLYRKDGIAKDIREKWMSMGIDLEDLQTGQGDWKHYDQTLLAVVLAYAIAFAYPFFDMSKNTSVSEEAARIMFVQFMVSNVQRLMYMYGSGVYEVFGTVFSGKFITSIIDTMYQMLAKSVYLARLLEKYPDSELLSDMVTYGFIVFFFYGDDHVASWPRVANQFKLYDESKNLLDDFVTFCVDILGMRQKVEEFKIFDNVFGERYFTWTDGVYVEDLELAVESPTFLKNQVAEVFIRDTPDAKWVSLGQLPYRATDDIASKLIFTLRSSSNPHLAVMSSMSYASLLSGNLEGYCMVRAFYNELEDVVGELSVDHWDYFRSTVGENSARRVAKGGSFPNLDQLIFNQRSGRIGKGFVPKDFNGNVSPQSYLYTDTNKGNDQKITMDFSERAVYDYDSSFLDQLRATADDYIGDDDYSILPFVKVYDDDAN
jgi:hypothetical protein